MAKRSKFPKKPSEIITVALDDLRKAERSPEYKVDMNYWHEPDSFSDDHDDPVCRVCLAGAVIANTFHYSPHVNLTPSGVDCCNRDMDILDALDQLRQGDSSCLLDVCNAKSAPSLPEGAYEMSYVADPQGFYRVLRAYARRLARAGY